MVSPRTDIRDDYEGKVEARIGLSPEFAPEAFTGLESFSHVEVVFFFDRVPEDRVEHRPN